MSTRGTLLKVASAVATVSVGTAMAIAFTTPGEASVPRAQAPAVAKQPQTTLHLPSTIHLISSPDGTITLQGRHKIVSTVLTRTKSGSAIGSSVYTCVESHQSDLILNCTHALALIGGIILTTETVDEGTGQIKGTVTGGSGKYAGISGTITGAARQDRGVNLTINYS